MSHVEWLRARSAEAPAALVNCIAELFQAHPEWKALPRTEVFLAAGEVLLERVLAGDPKSRASALDLLAADACVTYAFEAAADAPLTVAPLAERAKRRIAAIAAKAGPAAPAAPR